MRSVSGDRLALGGWMPFFSRLEAVAGRQRVVQGWHRPQGPADRPSGQEASTSLDSSSPRRTGRLGLTCRGHAESPQQVKG